MKIEKKEASYMSYAQPYPNYILNIKDNNKIKIKYHNKDKEKEIKIFGDNFVKNNKDKCKIFYNNKEYDLTTKFNVENINQLEIELYGILKINNMSCMFHGCSSLTSLPNISNWDTKNVTNMSLMFCHCSKLSVKPNLKINK